MDNFVDILLEWIKLGINLYYVGIKRENEWYIMGIMIMLGVFN